MARTKAISLIQNGATKVELAELSGLVIQNIQKDTLASGLKSQSYTGNPASGSVEYRRFKNSVSQDYGTARAAGKGTALTVPPTTVNLNTHKEIVEEAAKFDLDTFGVGNIMARRADNHVDTVAAEFDTAFFQAAFDEGTAFTAPASATDPGKIMRLVLSPAFYGDMRDYLDKTVHNANVDTAAEDFTTFHGVRVYSSVFLPANAKAVIMIEGAIAQPAVIYPYKDPEKIPLSNDYGVSMFYDFGTKVLTPDLVFTYSVTE